MTDIPMTGAIQVQTATLTRSVTWALRSFGDHPRHTLAATPQTLSYVVPERTDIAGVVPYTEPSGGPLSLDLAALVQVDEHGELADTSRVEVFLAVVGLGDTMPHHINPGSGPRLLCPHPYKRAAWVYCLGSTTLVGAGWLHDDRFHPRPVPPRGDPRAIRLPEQSTGRDS